MNLVVFESASADVLSTLSEAVFLLPPFHFWTNYIKKVTKK